MQNNDDQDFTERKAVAAEQIAAMLNGQPASSITNKTDKTVEQPWNYDTWKKGSGR